MANGRSSDCNAVVFVEFETGDASVSRNELVLLPDRLEGRSVRAGQLGCPVCGRTFELAEGVLDVGNAPPSPLPSALDAEAITRPADPGRDLATVGNEDCPIFGGRRLASA